MHPWSCIKFWIALSSNVDFLLQKWEGPRPICMSEWWGEIVILNYCSRNTKTCWICKLLWVSKSVKVFAFKGMEMPYLICITLKLSYFKQMWVNNIFLIPKLCRKFTFRDNPDVHLFKVFGEPSTEARKCP